jgi:hypothetical protein
LSYHYSSFTVKAFDGVVYEQDFFVLEKQGFVRLNTRSGMKPAKESARRRLQRQF